MVLMNKKPYYQDNSAMLYNGDCRFMSELADETVQMVCCSPPYWGLRKYAGLPDLIWDGDGSCEHTEMMPDSTKHDNLRFRGEHSIVGNEKNREIHPVHSWVDNQCEHKWEDATYKRRSSDSLPGLSKERYNEKTYDELRRDKPINNAFCSLCGAWKGQLGLEPTPELYISHLVEIFREVRRVLRKDGAVFVNCGDSYFGGGNNRGNNSPISDKQASNFGAVGQCSEHQKNIGKHPVLKPKDLCLIPFRLAIELQRDGWWVRSVIIWSKNNPMPESVKDRPTESHEYILLLTKSSRYYWDAEAVREPQSHLTFERFASNPLKTPVYENHKGFNREGCPDANIYAPNAILPNGRNLRSVWTFSTQSYKEAHFATYPEELVKRCVLVATPEIGCCPKCGKPWVRIVEKEKPPFKDTRTPGEHTPTGNGKIAGSKLQKWIEEHPIQTLGWKPQCKCSLPQSENIGSIVLDPFAGSGTTLAVARKLGRQSVGYELSKIYCDLAVKRITAVTPPFPNLLT